eukprot:scaffold45945_cov460-Skeletonema_marinoi.AAC.1
MASFNIIDTKSNTSCFDCIIPSNTSKRFFVHFHAGIIQCSPCFLLKEDGNDGMVAGGDEPVVLLTHSHRFKVGVLHNEVSSRYLSLLEGFHN